MSLKRKASELSSANTAPISAFAARQWQKSNSVAESSDDEAGSDGASREIGSEEEAALTFRDESLAEESDSSFEPESRGDKTQDRAFANIQLSTWSGNRADILACTEDVLTLRLKPGEKVTFIGQYDLWVKSGTVSLCGAILCSDQEIHHVFAPSTHAVPSITCVSSRPCKIAIWHCGLTMRTLEKLSPHYRRIWNDRSKELRSNPSRGAFERSFSLIQNSSDDSRVLYSFEIPPAWYRFIDVSNRSDGSVPAILVCGRKDSGKSTFCRFVVNNLIRNRHKSQESSTSNSFSVLYWLDLDPGQSEFSPPGQVSLVRVAKPIFGPPFTHANAESASLHYRLIRAHCIGGLSPIDDPQYFLACSADLQSHYQRLSQASPPCPLVINCPGWSTKGWFGLELTLQIMRNLKTTDIVYLGDRRLANGVDPFFAAAGITPFHHLPSVAPPLLNPSKTAAELREMQTISYFHSATHQNSEVTKWSEQPIYSQTPRRLKYDGNNPEILGVTTVIEHPPTPDFLSTVTEKWVVALCVMGDDLEVAEAAANIARTKVESLPYWPAEKANDVFRPTVSKSQVVGWAYVTDINVETRTVGLISPLCDSTWQMMRGRTENGHPRIVLIRGQTDAPTWAYLEPLYLESRKSRENQQAKDACDTAVRYEAAELPADFDMGSAERSRLDGRDYVQKATGSTGVGGKEWTQKPRLVKFGDEKREVK